MIKIFLLSMVAVLISCASINNKISYTPPSHTKIEATTLLQADVTTVWIRLMERLPRENFFIDNSTLTDTPTSGLITVTFIPVPAETFVTCGMFAYKGSGINTPTKSYNPLQDITLPTSTSLNRTKYTATHNADLKGRANISITPHPNGGSVLQINALFEFSLLMVERSKNGIVDMAMQTVLFTTDRGAELTEAITGQSMTCQSTGRIENTIIDLAKISL